MCHESGKSHKQRQCGSTAIECIDNECSMSQRMSKKIQIIQMELCLHHTRTPSGLFRLTQKYVRYCRNDKVSFFLYKNIPLFHVGFQSFLATIKVIRWSSIRSESSRFGVFSHSNNIGKVKNKYTPPHRSIKMFLELK